jgi:methanogenic corrinoid protein MtbC1
MIEQEIIPRLLLSHQLGEEQRRPEPARPAQPTSDDVSELAQLVIQKPVAIARSYVEGVRARGVSLDIILLSLLTPAARLLGELWLDDLCTFADVTVGLSRLHQIVYELSPASNQNRLVEAAHGIVVLCPAPGEQHTFGMLIAGEFFRKAGWNVRALLTTDGQELTELVRNEWVAMVGFSVSVEGRAEQLRGVIENLRGASRNPDLIVMLGGGGASQRRDDDRLGATLCTSDALEAVHFLERVAAAKVEVPTQPQESN